MATRAQAREKREQHLQRRVKTSLCLSPPPQVCAPYPKSTEEQKASARLYKSKLRTNRLLQVRNPSFARLKQHAEPSIRVSYWQVRAQDALLATQRLALFRDRKAAESKNALNHLKDVWREEQRRRIASLEAEFVKSCRSVGSSHDAACTIEYNQAVKCEIATKQAEESKFWDALRFEKAIHKERELNKWREREECFPLIQRKIVEKVSNIERSFAHSHRPKSEPHEKKASGCYQTTNSKNARGCPNDFKDTYLHSRFEGGGGGARSGVVTCPEPPERMDAWRAAGARRESVRSEKLHQIELNRLCSERQLERGNAAAAKLIHDQRIEALEDEVEEAWRCEEEREKDRVYAAALIPGEKRTIHAVQSTARSVYIKHKISNPLSCPGLPHTSRTCSRCRSCVELIPAPREASPDWDSCGERDDGPDFSIVV